MFYIKCIGAAFILVSAFLISRRCAVFYNKKHKECQQMLSFTKKMRKDIGTFLLPASKWKIDFNESLDGCQGFFTALRDGADLKTAFLAAKERLALPSEIKSELEAFFSDFGRGYAKDELAKLDNIISILVEAEKKISEEVKNDSRAVKALIIAFALGLIILLI